MANKLSSYALRALQVLQAGGKFRKQLESGFRGREQFQTRLFAADGFRIGGIGFKTFLELRDANFLISIRPYDSRSSAWPEEWILNPLQVLAASNAAVPPAWFQQEKVAA